MSHTAAVHAKGRWTAPDKSIAIDLSIECCWDAVIDAKRHRPECRASSKEDQLTVSKSLRRLGKLDGQKVQTKVPWSLIHSAACTLGTCDRRQAMVCDSDPQAVIAAATYQYSKNLSVWVSTLRASKNQYLQQILEHEEITQIAGCSRSWRKQQDVGRDHRVYLLFAAQ